MLHIHRCIEDPCGLANFGIEYFRRNRLSPLQKCGVNVVQGQLRSCWVPQIFATETKASLRNTNVEWINGLVPGRTENRVQRLEFGIFQEIDASANQRMRFLIFPVQTDGLYRDPHVWHLMTGEQVRAARRDRVIQPNDSVEVWFVDGGKRRAADAAFLVARVVVTSEPQLKPSLEVKFQHLFSCSGRGWRRLPSFCLCDSGFQSLSNEGYIATDKHEAIR